MPGADAVRHTKIDFERELNRGRRAYDRIVGKWWQQRSDDASHAYAYRKIARHARSLFHRPPHLIVDYACGSGGLLTRLYGLFPRTEIVGVDGSRSMLDLAERRLSRLGRDAVRAVSLVHVELPASTPPVQGADLVIFAFPNIVATQNRRPGGGPEDDRLRPDDVAVGRVLAAAREPDPEDETVFDDAQTVYESMMEDRAVARNIRRLLKRGGYCVRSDYSNAAREELTDLVQKRAAFEECSLRVAVNGRKPARFFRFLRSEYSRSKVMEDVYHQTGDRSDIEGGYMLTSLKAI